jgi:hypothetical protein
MKIERVALQRVTLQVLRVVLGAALISLVVASCIHTWGALAVYRWVLNGLVIFGFVCATFVAVTWTPYIIRAQRKERLRVSRLAVIDWATLAYLGAFVFGLRIVLSITEGTPDPASAPRALLNLAIWILFVFKLGLRAYIWLRALRRPGDALNDVSEQVRTPLEAVDER